MSASALKVEIRVSSWRAMWGLRAVGLAMRISPHGPRVIKALQRAAVKAINWGIRVRMNDKRIKTQQLVTGKIFE